MLGVLTLAKLAPGSESYYLDAVAHGAEDYYVGRGEAAGHWMGRGAALLALDGERVASITRFGDRAVLARFGLPRTLVDD